MHHLSVVLFIRTVYNKMYIFNKEIGRALCHHKHHVEYVFTLVRPAAFSCFNFAKFFYNREALSKGGQYSIESWLYFVSTTLSKISITLKVSLLW